MKTHAERDYDATYNEGGDGYNPHRAERHERERQAALATPRTRDDICRELERLDCSLARECGTYDADKIAALKSELAAVDKAENDAFAAEWTREVTIARRAEWNAEADKLVAKHGRNVPGVEVRKLTERLGYGMREILAAKEIHGI